METELVPDHIIIDTDFSSQSSSKDTNSLQSDEDTNKWIWNIDEHCLVCGDLAVHYDCNGNVIKTEAYSRSDKKGFTRQHLFSALCASLGIRKNSRSKKIWDFDSRPFPFCMACQSLMMSIADISQKLEQLGNEMKEKLKGSESKYENGLYERHDERYYTFRKEVLTRLGYFRITQSKLEQEAVTTSAIVQSDSDDEIEIIECSQKLTDLNTPHLPENSKVTFTSKASIENECIAPDTTLYDLDKCNDNLSKVEDLTSLSPVFNHGHPRKYTKKLRVMRSMTKKRKFRKQVTSPKQKMKIIGRPKKPKPNMGNRNCTIDKATGNITYSSSYGGGRVSFTRLFEKQQELSYVCSTCQEEIMFEKKIEFNTLRNHGMRCETRKIFQNSFCPVCAKPVAHNASREYKLHRLTHLSEEEKAEALRKCGNNIRKIVFPGGKAKKRIIVDGSNAFKPGEVNQCPTCGKFISRGIDGMARHERTHLPLEERLNWMCFVCGAQFTAKSTMDTHIKLIHSDRPETTSLGYKKKYRGRGRVPNVAKKRNITQVEVEEDQNAWKCMYLGCLLRFKSSLELESHVTAEHFTSPENEQSIMCKVCGRVMSCTWALRQHSLVHSGERKFKCTHCSKSYPIKSTLRMHLQAIHGEGSPVKCEVAGCQRIFPCRQYLRQHMKQVHKQSLGISKPRKKMGESRR